jgi:hypothetical protein
MKLALSVVTVIAVFCASVMIYDGSWGLALVTGFITGLLWRVMYVEYIHEQNIALQAMYARFAEDQAEYDAESDPFKDVGKPPF